MSVGRKESNLPTIVDLRSAARRIYGIAVRTPLLESIELDTRVSGRVLIKAESLQRTGSYKFRGAYNRLAQLSSEERSLGVVSSSTGNFAQAFACAAQHLRVRVTIVMPLDAPEIKIKNARDYGADIVFIDQYKSNLSSHGAMLAKERGVTYVHPFEERSIIAGQGTVGLEIAKQAAAAQTILDALLLPCAGGSLTAGCALAFEAISPETAIYSVEPKEYGTTFRSLAIGERVAINFPVYSICDALRLEAPGINTFAVNKRLLTGGLLVSDDEVLAAIDYAFHTLRLVVEPGGAVALAAVLSGKINCHGKTLGIVLSGGNIDPDLFCSAIRRDRNRELAAATST